MTIDTTKTTVSDLKKVKNSVIGNPLAKDGIVRNEELMRRLIQSIADSENETPEEVKIEAAHIVASLSYGSEIALSALLKLNTPYVFVFALSKLFPEGSTTLRAAYARALRALVSSIADVVGPSEYGLRPETPPSLRLDAKEALDGMFSLDTLDVILPLLLSPSPQIQTPIVQLIASATRSSVHRAILVSWLPPDERRKEQGKAKKRGWEKLSASSSSSSSGSPVSPGASGTSASWIVKVLVVVLARTKGTDAKLQEAVLLGMAALSKENAAVAVALGRGVGVVDVHGVAPLALILSYTKSRNVDVQLAACLCATHIIRGISSTHLPPPSSLAHLPTLTYSQSLYASLPLDDACIRAVVNMVNRVVGAEGLGEVERRVKACFVLYHLTTDDKPLCQLAFERGCLDTLVRIVKDITPPDPVPVPVQMQMQMQMQRAKEKEKEKGKEGVEWRWDESEGEGVTRLREAALTAIATLTLFSEPVRKAITGPHALLPYISTALKQGLPMGSLGSSSTSSGSTATPTKRVATSAASTNMGVVAGGGGGGGGGVVGRGRRIDYTPGVRYAACQCVRVIARGVSVLRTNIVDSGLGMEVFRIVVRGSKSSSLSKEQVDEFDDERESGGQEQEQEQEQEEDRRVLNAALAAVCNIVMEFSPLRPIYLEHGLMPRLVQLLLRSGDGAIRMNALWAIKNLLYKSSTETKRDVMRELGWARVFELLHDTDLGIQEQAYHVVRNLSESDEGIEMVFRELGVDAILDSITESISVEDGVVVPTPVSPTGSPSASTSASASVSGSGVPGVPSSSYAHPLQDRTPTILQALSALANLCNGPHHYTAQILAKPKLLTNLKTCLAECGAEVRKVGVGCVLTLVQEHPRKRRVFVDAGVVGTLRRLCEWVPTTTTAAGTAMGHHHHHQHHQHQHQHQHHQHHQHAAAVYSTPAHSYTPVPASPTMNIGGVSASASAPSLVTGPASSSVGNVIATYHGHGIPSYLNTSPAPGVGGWTAGSGAGAPVGAYPPGFVPPRPRNASTSTTPTPTTNVPSSLALAASAGQGLGYGYRGMNVEYPGEEFGSASGSTTTATMTTGFASSGYVNAPPTGFAYPHHPPVVPSVHQHHSYVAPASGSSGAGAGVGSGSGSGSVHPALDMDKEVYERARMALDWLERGDGYGM